MLTSELNAIVVRTYRNVSFGHDRHVVVEDFDAPDAVREAAARLVLARGNVGWIEAELHRADLAGDGRKKALHEDELRYCHDQYAAAARDFRAALSSYNRWACVVALGHASYVSEEVRGESSIRCEPVDGRTACRSCYGCGERRFGDVGDVVPCDVCGTTGVLLKPAPGFVRRALGIA